MHTHMHTQIHTYIVFILSTSKLLHKLFLPLAINQINKVESFFWGKVFSFHRVYVAGAGAGAGGGGGGSGGGGDDDVDVFVERLYFFSVNVAIRANDRKKSSWKRDSV